MILYGWHSVKAALENPARRFRRLLATENAAHRLAESGLALPLAPTAVSAQEIEALVGPDAVHQGILAEADPLEAPAIEDLEPQRLVLVLDQITDPHNVGAILRSAAAFAVEAVIVTTRHSPEATGVLAKAASAALEHVPLVTVPNLARALDVLKDKNVFVVGLDSSGEVDLASVPVRAPLALVVGAEGKGLRQLTRTHCDAVARIALPGRIKSLNVSNATALALFVASGRLRSSRGSRRDDARPAPSTCTHAPNGDRSGFRRAALCSNNARRPPRDEPRDDPSDGRTALSILRSIAGASLLAFLAAAASTHSASAQDFPTRPIVLVVPYAAGGNVDISARALQAGIGNSLGQPVVVENRPGAGGTIAGQYVARSAPDGYTLFVGSNGPVMLGPMTMPTPPYQWQQAFAPVSTLAVATNTLVVRPTLPVKSVAELVDHARKNPGKLSVAIDSVASINHFMGELFKLKSGITWTEVPYRGNAPAVADLIAGHVDVGFFQLVDTAPHLKAGTLRALAILGPQRAPSLPDVPTIGEAGYPDAQGTTFNGVFAPKGTPPAVIDKLSAAIRAALAKPEVVARLAALGSTAHGSTPDEFAKFLAQESDKWTEVMKRANIKVTE